MANASETRPERAHYRHFQDIPTRWMDNDIYGHVNNVVYYAYFDTVINCYLIDHAGFDIHGAPVIGVAVETMCRFHRAFAYPQIITAGLSVAHLGRTSVRYEVGLFADKDDQVRAHGHFVHVFVERANSRPAAIPLTIRTALEKLRR